jgi:hypothetical protein
MSKQNKASRPEIERRLRLVMNMIVDGTESVEQIREVLIEFYQKKRGEVLDITARQVENYVSKCFDRIKKANQKTDEYVFDMLVKRNLNVYQKALAAKQYGAANMALRELAKLQGQYKPEQVELANKDGKAFKTQSDVVIYLPDNGRD